MPEKIDVVLIVSEAYHNLSMSLAGILPSEPGYNDLEQRRAELGTRLDRLVREFFKDNTHRFVAANSRLAEANQHMQDALDKLQSMKEMIDAVTSLVSEIDKFIATVFPVPA